MLLIPGNWSLLDSYFPQGTMSVHWKANCPTLSKAGRPWGRDSVVSTTIVSKEELELLVSDLLLEATHREDGFLEIDRQYSKVLQVWPYRIVIVYPPLSDALELTVVKPVRKLSMEDYWFDENIVNRLRYESAWVLIAWSPGEGKTTFAQALVDLYVQDHKVIKTIESPRDLNVDKTVVQYSFNYAPHHEVRDILLLSRPDIAIYDEVRNKEDFLLFKDLRLTGIWLVGIIHATKPIDSIQRLIGTIEMGMIPEVIDTIVFIKGGTITEILTLKHVVKMPSGMLSEDLARPVIEVSSFLDGQLKYEIYTYGEQVVVMPLDMLDKTKKSDSIVSKLATAELTRKIMSITGVAARIEINWLTSIKLYVDEDDKWAIIGRGWENIQKLEKELWLSISVATADDLPPAPPSLKPIHKWGNRAKRRR
jgi:ATPase